MYDVNYMGWEREKYLFCNRAFVINVVSMRVLKISGRCCGKVLWFCALSKESVSIKYTRNFFSISVLLNCI